MNIRAMLLLLSATGLVAPAGPPPADMLLESRLFKGTRTETAVQAPGPVVISSFASPILITPSLTAAEAEAEFRNAAAIKNELAEVYRQQNIEYLSTVRAVWKGRRNELRESLLLDNESYVIEYAPRMRSNAKAGLKVTISKGGPKNKTAAGGGEGGETILDTEIEMNLNEPAILGFPNNGTSYFLAVELSVQPPSGAGRGAVLKDGRVSLIGDVVAPPKSVRWVIPTYPESCKQAGIEGTVLLSVTTDSSGSLTDVRVMKSIHPDLDKTAQEALRQWLYEPVYKEGRAVPATFFVLVEFRLRPPAASTGLPSSARPLESAAGSSPVLAAILRNSAEYCRKLAQSALYFICEERVDEALYQFGSVEYAIVSAEGATTYAPSYERRAKRNSYVCDYQLMKKGEAIEEKRILLEENGKKTGPRSAPSTNRGFYSQRAVFGPVGFLDREWHNAYHYELLKRERALGREAYVVRAVPKVRIEGKPNYGNIWVDANDYSVLKIEVEVESLAGYEKFRNEAKKKGLTPIFTTVHEYAVVKNGLRFPSRTVFEESYTGLKNSFAGRTRSRTEIAYGNYKFFTVDTEVVLK